jgi:hypothetical protein
MRRRRERPTYKGLIQWLNDGKKILAVTPDNIFWLSDALNYTELDRGIGINYDCWLEYN